MCDTLLVCVVMHGVWERVSRVLLLFIICIRAHSSNQNAAIWSDFEAEVQMMYQKHDNTSQTRAAHLDMAYQELENATQVALEAAFNDQVCCQSDRVETFSVLMHAQNRQFICAHACGASGGLARAAGRMHHAEQQDQRV